MNQPRRPLSAMDLATLGVLVGAAALTALVYPRLPDPMPTHFGLDGRPNGWMPRAVGAWVVLGAGSAVVILVRLGAAVLPPGWRDRLEASPVRAIGAVVAALMAALQVLLLRASLSAVPRMGSAPLVLLGAFLVAMGLLAPRTRRNPFVGVRTAFSLSSDENWARTHRVAGYAMFIGGFVTMLAASVGATAAALASVIVSCAVPLFWSWTIARKGPGDATPSSHR